MRHRFFERPSVKHLAVVAMAFLLGMAVANGWTTRDAMVGQARWLHDQCGQVVKKKIEARKAAEYDTFGFLPEEAIATKK